ncbi:hypothetical protein [Sphingomonas sp.]|jgi:hypothetical protein|uniref:hypothetical protein n=1 Tax=Sphingomonas sp. TaxID=28214 RepID=UPI002EDA61F4
MTLDLAASLRHARALWRADRAILWPLSGLLIFLPQYAVLLLIPPMPASAPGATVETWGKALEPWIASYGAWYVAVAAIGQFGALAIVSLYALPPRTAGGALARALLLFPRLLLASAVVMIPCAAALLLALSVPLAPLVAIPALVYVLARTALVGPIITGDRRTGAVAAVVRSWRLTQGHGLQIALLVGAIMVGGQALGTIAVTIEQAVRAGAFSNPVLLAMIDAVAAAAAWAAALALALVEVVLYRRLVR